MLAYSTRLGYERFGFLAAKDYWFDNDSRRKFFKNFINLIPLSRRQNPESLDLEDTLILSKGFVRIGDWISMPNNNADGDVISISLSSVQIQNFDNTITSIPTYKLISDSFINWRGMSESQGRRIKRSLLIKIDSIHFMEDKALKDLEKIDKRNFMYTFICLNTKCFFISGS